MWCSFAEESSRSSAFLQLGNILESSTDVYELMMTLGGGEARHRLLRISQSLKAIPHQSQSESAIGVFSQLQSLVQCHASGFELTRDAASEISEKELNEWDIHFRYTIGSLLCVYTLYRMRFQSTKLC